MAFQKKEVFVHHDGVARKRQTDANLTALFQSLLAFFVRTRHKHVHKLDTSHIQKHQCGHLGNRILIRRGSDDLLLLSEPGLRGHSHETSLTLRSRGHATGDHGEVLRLSIRLVRVELGRV